MSEETAVRVAAENRLDLMNIRGRVIDAYRRVEVAADALEGDLDLVLEANIATDPNRINAFRFDASANRYRARVQFDSPLNRLAERTAYRAAQIDYQQARREYMAAHDQLVRQIRADLRRLEFNRFQFEITRQQLITAARQVEEAQFRIRNSREADSSLTRDLLSALQQLLNAKNSLIGSWVAYETSRMNLFGTWM
jgi:outer membrane protein TolC